MLSEIQEFQQWLRRKSPNASTHRHYANDVKLFFEWFGGLPHNVTVLDIDHFIEYSQSQGHAIATVNRRLAAIRTFYNFLSFNLDEPPENPVHPWRHYVNRSLRLPRDVQDEQISILFAVIRKPRDYAMFLLMLRCGLRVNEVRCLSLEDLYLHPSPGNLPRMRLNGKGSKERIVYLAVQPLDALTTWLEQRPATKSTAIFTNRFGNRMTVTGIQDCLAKYCKKAGLWVTCHQLRHTFGRHLTETRTPITSIQALLGHTWLSSTEIYLHLNDAQVQADYLAAVQKIIHRLSVNSKEGVR